MAKYGWHIIADCFNVSKEYLTDINNVVEFLDELVKLSKSTIVDRTIVPFDGDGFTMVYTLSESHISYHGWPEFHSMQIDLFTCSGDDLKSVEAKIIELFPESEVTILPRTIVR